MPKKRPAAQTERKLRLRVMMTEYICMGPGRADLIDAIGRTGSISAAAREMKMSYRRAWQLVETTNKSFVEPLVVANTGGTGGGGASVTEFGRGVVEHYRAMERKATESLAGDFAIFSQLLNPNKGADKEKTES
jgi:molybdate transport system regulatory protein